jgi:UTP-glucose-1-phosphate uridylyltransferase
MLKIIKAVIPVAGLGHPVMYDKPTGDDALFVVTPPDMLLDDA